jgi:hypothetical protein
MDRYLVNTYCILCGRNAAIEISGINLSFGLFSVVTYVSYNSIGNDMEGSGLGLD